MMNVIFKNIFTKCPPSLAKRTLPEVTYTRYQFSLTIHGQTNQGKHEVSKKMFWTIAEVFQSPTLLSKISIHSEPFEWSGNKNGRKSIHVSYNKNVTDGVAIP